MKKTHFTIYKRLGKDHKGLYVARFWDERGELLRSKYLSARTKSAAVLEAKALLDGGVVSSAENPVALEFLSDFWTEDSDYCKGRKLRGKALSLMYVELNRNAIRLFWEPFLSGRRIGEVTPDFVEKVLLKLSDKGYKARRLNTALSAVKIPVAWFCRMKRIPYTLSVVEPVDYTPRERGTLSAAEAVRLFDVKDEDPRVKTAVILGAWCGMRRGEILGLQSEDVDEVNGIIHIRNNYVHTREGLKGPKYNSVRDVPAPKAVFEVIRESLSFGRGNYVCWNEDRDDRPCTKRLIDNGFRRVLKAIGVSEVELKERNITFHAMRHTYVSLTRASGLPDWLTMRLSGHKSAAMLERYSHGGERVIDFAKTRESFEATIRDGGKAASI